jgi:hypothetical protein
MHGEHRAMLTSLGALALSVALLNNGPCLDSPKGVPQTLDGGGRGDQIVRIDKVVSTSSMIDGQVIGFLYTREDGSTYLSQRGEQYMSAADSSAVNNLLSASHLPGTNVTAFPPRAKYGVRTGYQEFFPVRIPASTLGDLRIRFEPCVAWPAGNPLPDSQP